MTWVTRDRVSWCSVWVVPLSRISLHCPYFSLVLTWGRMVVRVSFLIQ